MFGAVIAGITIPMVNSRWGWRFNFALLAGLGIIWAVVWLFLAKEGPLENKGQSASAPRSLPSRADSKYRVGYGALFSDSTVAYTIILHLTAYLAFAIVFTWLPVFLSEGLGYDQSRAGQLFSVVLIATTPVNLALSACSQRMLLRGTPSRIARGALRDHSHSRSRGLL